MRNHTGFRVLAAAVVCLQLMLCTGVSALAAGQDRALVTVSGETGYGPAYDALTTDFDRETYQAFYWSAAHDNGYAKAPYTEDTHAYMTAMHAFRSDWPEYWYVDRYWTQICSDGCYVRVDCQNLTDSEIASCSAQVDAIASEVASRAAAYASDADRAAYVADWICAFADYGKDDEGLQQYAATLLLKQYGVCEAYARTYDLIMKKLGIPCLTVTGSVDGGGHAWNEVQLDGTWYAVDTTWMDSAYGDRYLFMSHEVYEQDGRTTDGYVSYPDFADWQGAKP